ncbi:MAG: alpha/beta hydrolase [Ruminococcaceae bacterium]|nr:alpha/beta hydrolase [Oscillospiraceae bacterium]MBR3596803.1 alpha/beta hydrolase [Clostridia bacterium]
MSDKKKTDILKVFAGAAIAAASVLFIWMLSEPRFYNIPPVILIAVIIAFIGETALLVVLRGKNILKRIIKIILLLAVNISVFTCAVIYSFAPAFILQPHSDETSYEALKTHPSAEEISFEGTNGSINGWFYNAAGRSAPTVLYFYGNYETASTRLLQLSRNYENSAFRDCNFAVFDYPSYGKTEGRCSDDTLLAFSLDVFDKLSEITDNIIVLGYSVGTGPACYLASKRDVKALVLYAPYSNGVDLYNNVIDIFHGALEGLVSFNIENEIYASQIAEKALVFASPSDELIPYSSSMRLSEKFDVCNFVTVQGIGHNDFLSNGEIKEKTAGFIKEVTAE